MDILTMTLFAASVLAKYMQRDILYQDEFLLMVVSDSLILLQLILYIIAIKFKNIIFMILDWAVFCAALGTKVAVIVEVGEMADVHASEWVTIACLVVGVGLLVYPSIIWKMVIRKKWVKYFDLAKKFGIVTEMTYKQNKQSETRPRQSSFGDN